MGVVLTKTRTQKLESTFVLQVTQRIRSSNPQQKFKGEGERSLGQVVLQQNQDGRFVVPLKGGERRRSRGISCSVVVEIGHRMFSQVGDLGRMDRSRQKRSDRYDVGVGGRRSRRFLVGVRRRKGVRKVSGREEWTQSERKASPTSK